MSSAFPNSVEAVLLAGGTFEEVPEGETPPKGKGLLEIAKVPLAARVLKALRGSEAISRIIMVSPVPAEELSDPVWQGIDQVVPAQDKLIDSFKAGVDAVSDPLKPALVTVGDLPLLTSESVSDWIERCRRRSEAEIWYSFLRRSNSEAAFPGVRHTYVPFREGVFCGAGFFLSRPRALDSLYMAMAKLAEARKHPLELAKLLGPKIVWGLLTRRLSISLVEQKMQQLLGGTICAGVESPYPETAFNVDELETLEIARQYFSNSNA